jgi:inorganic pyrophosphatase
MEHTVYHTVYDGQASDEVPLDRIVAISVRGPAFAEYTDKSQLPSHLLREVRRFFEDYKTLEHKQVVVENLLGPDAAVDIIREALEMYRQLRRGELKRV